MRQLDVERSGAPDIDEPSSPDSPEAEEKQKLLVCTVCDDERRFRMAAIFARHFNASHPDLKKDAESWREHYEEIYE